MSTLRRIFNIAANRTRGSQYLLSQVVVLNRRSISTTNPVDPSSSSKPLVGIVSGDSTVVDLVPGTTELFSGSYWTYPGDIVMTFIDNIHVMTGLEYWQAISALAFAVRICLVPLAIKTQQQTARLAIMRPENDALRDKYLAMPGFNESVELRTKFMEETRALMAKHNCNPMRAMSLPIIQLPIFLSFFDGLRKMHEYFPGFSTGN